MASDRPGSRDAGFAAFPAASSARNSRLPFPTWVWVSHGHGLTDEPQPRSHARWKWTRFEAGITRIAATGPLVPARSRRTRSEAARRGQRSGGVLLDLTAAGLDRLGRDRSPDPSHRIELEATAAPLRSSRPPPPCVAPCSTPGDAAVRERHRRAHVCARGAAAPVRLSDLREVDVTRRSRSRERRAPRAPARRPPAPVRPTSSRSSAGLPWVT